MIAYVNGNWQIYPPFKKTGQLTTSGSSYTISGGSDMQTTTEYGYYYSDPTASNGVSTSCSSANQYTTLQVYPTAPALRYTPYYLIGPYPHLTRTHNNI